MSDNVEYGFHYIPMPLKEWDVLSSDWHLSIIEDAKVVATRKALREGFLLKQHTIRAQVLREQMSTEWESADGTLVQHPAMVCIHVTAEVY